MYPSQVAIRLTALFRKEIKRQGLIDTGKLFRSIKWRYNNGSFQMIAENYYYYLDEKYFITNNVKSSDEFKRVMVEWTTYLIQKELKQSLKLK